LIFDIEPDTTFFKSKSKKDLKNRNLIDTELYPPSVSVNLICNVKMLCQNLKMQKIILFDNEVFILNKTNTDLELAEKTLKRISIH
jgi:hypothetical protein